MAWQDEAIPILRVLIDDLGSPYRYDDSRLEELLVSIAKLLVAEISFPNDYTVTVKTTTITPDPELDSSFISLLCLKTAYNTSNSEYRQYSISSVQVTDGPSTISMQGSSTSLKARVERLAKDYENAKLQYTVGNAVGCCSVLTPYTNSSLFYINHYGRQQNY